MIKKVIRKIKGIIRIKKLNKNNNCNIDLKANVDNTNIIEFNNIGRNTTIINSEIGEYSYLGSNCVFSNVKIGRFCSIANNIKVICGSHPSNTFVSTSPYFYRTINNNIKTINNDVEYKEFEYCDQDNKFLCIIGNDVWIGENVQILQGVKIGDGAIIGANSLITKNIEPYSIVGGVPAKIIKYRFKKEEINFLCELKWWDKEISWIKKYSKYFNNVEELIQILNKEKEVKYHDKEN